MRSSEMTLDCGLMQHMALNSGMIGIVELTELVVVVVIMIAIMIWCG